MFADRWRLFRWRPARRGSSAVIGAALGVGETGELPVVESLAMALRNQRLLLLLDNYEHLLAGAPVVADLLVRCPGL
jgi:hypothetical protein